jgi:MFS family permease
LGMVTWSLVQSAAGFVSNITQLYWSRIGLGITESPLSPSTVRALRTWFRPEDRGLAISIAFSGASLGPAIAPPLLTWLMLGWGWRVMFVIVGVLGIVLGCVWWSYYRDPTQQKFVEGELNELPSEITPLAHGVKVGQLLELFRYRTFWGMVLGNFGLVYLAWLYITWLPGYLEIERHMSVARAGIYAGIPQVLGLLGFWSGGWLGDYLLRSGYSQSTSRKIPIIGGLLAMATATVPAAIVHNDMIAIMFISVAVFFGSMSQPAQWALVSYVAPANRISTFSAVTNFGGSIGGSLSAVITGYIAQRTGSFAPALILGGAVATAAACLYGFAVGKPIEEPALEHAGV